MTRAKHQMPIKPALANALAFLNIDALDQQETPAPTEAVQVRYRHDGRKRITVEQCRRRKQDARIFEGMTLAQESAFDLIYSGWRALASDVMTRCGFDLLRVDGSRESYNPEAAADLAHRYYRWARACRGEGIGNASILYIIAEGRGLRDAEKMYRMAHGTAKPNLIAGLDLYCKMWGMRY